MVLWSIKVKPLTMRVLLHIKHAWGESVMKYNECLLSKVLFCTLLISIFFSIISIGNCSASEVASLFACLSSLKKILVCKYLTNHIASAGEGSLYNFVSFKNEGKKSVMAFSDAACTCKAKRKLAKSEHLVWAGRVYARYYSTVSGL